MISGELSVSRLIRFELGGSARAALHSAHLLFRLPWGQGLHFAQPCSACREGRVCTPRSCLSASRWGTAYEGCSRVPPSRWVRGCTPRSRVSPRRAGRGCTLRTSLSPCRGDTGYTPCTCLSAFRASTASYPSLPVCRCLPRASTCARTRGVVAFVFVGSQKTFSFLPRKEKSNDFSSHNSSPHFSPALPIAPWPRSRLCREMLPCASFATPWAAVKSVDLEWDEKLEVMLFARANRCPWDDERAHGR